MKKTLACPKCESRKLWRVDGIRAKGEYKNTHLQLLVAVQRRTPPIKRESIWSDGSKVYDAAPIDAYVCALCGYTELWARDMDKLVHNPESGVHFIDTTPQRGEYR